jgi:hypothetical protein
LTGARCLLSVTTRLFERFSAAANVMTPLCKYIHSAIYQLMPESMIWQDPDPFKKAIVFITALSTLDIKQLNTRGNEGHIVPEICYLPGIQASI